MKSKRAKAAAAAVDIALTTTQAKSIVKPGAQVHTFEIGFCMAGCDMDRNAVYYLIDQEGGVKLSNRCGLGHELAVMQDGRPIYVETDEAQVEALRKTLAQG